jgi:mono/diheme cytochrome c family protein
MVRPRRTPYNQISMSIKNAARILLASTWLLGTALQSASFAQTSPVGEAGRGEYLRYCASCHGPEARGDGPVAASLSPKVPDLTKISARRDGNFPTGELAVYIDGRSMPGAHGSRAMPVWGDVLSEDLVEGERGEELVRGRVRMILIYLKSVQQ